jgi:hypothetical protein
MKNSCVKNNITLSIRDLDFKSVRTDVPKAVVLSSHIFCIYWIYFYESQPMFRRNMLSPFSGLKFMQARNQQEGGNKQAAQKIILIRCRSSLRW